MKLKIVYFICLLLWLPIAGVAQQENCATKLKKAEKLFDEGKLEEMLATLDECMRFGFSRSQKIRAYELIIQALLADENYNEAERKMVRLLKMEPTFTTEKKVLSGEFVDLYERLKTRPVVSIGLYGGPLFTRNVVSEEFGNHNILTSHGKYSSKTGYQVGLLSEFYLTNSLLADVEVCLLNTQYEYRLDDALPATNSGYTEKQSRIDIPVSLKYQSPFGRFAPFVQFGAAPGFVLDSKVQAERTYRDNSLPPISSADIDVDYKREQFSLQLFAGVGVSARIKRNVVFVVARYGAGLRPYVKESAHTNDPEFSSQYFILDDRFKLNTIQLLVGYTFSFYTLNKTSDY